MESHALYRLVLGLQERVNNLSGGVAPATSVDLSEVNGRIAALEGKPAASVDLSEVNGRLAALEGKPEASVVDLTEVYARLLALENKPVVDYQLELIDLSNRLSQVEKRPDYNDRLAALEVSFANILSAVNDINNRLNST